MCWCKMMDTYIWLILGWRSSFPRINRPIVCVGPHIWCRQNSSTMRHTVSTSIGGLLGSWRSSFWPGGFHFIWATISKSCLKPFSTALSNTQIASKSRCQRPAEVSSTSASRSHLKTAWATKMGSKKSFLTHGWQTWTSKTSSTKRFNQHMLLNLTMLEMAHQEHHQDRFRFLVYRLYILNKRYRRTNISLKISHERRSKILMNY